MGENKNGVKIKIKKRGETKEKNTEKQQQIFCDWCKKKQKYVNFKENKFDFGIPSPTAR